MVFNVSDLQVYAHRSKQFHVILGEDNMRQECGTHHTRAVMTEPLLVLDVDDQGCDLRIACGTSFHGADRFVFFKNWREEAGPYSYRNQARISPSSSLIWLGTC